MEQSIAIIGGCQVLGLAEAARALMPQATIRHWHVGNNLSTTPSIVADALDGATLVVSQFDAERGPVELRTGSLHRRGFQVVHLPVFAFSGFHPDLIYLRGSLGTLLPGAETDYHSRIAAAAFRLGLSVERGIRLFNGYVFANLGYFDQFQIAKDSIVGAFSRSGYFIGDLMDEWMRQTGPFMHTINHPRILVMAALGRLALQQGGFLSADAPTPSELPDYLASSFIAPVFPPLARRLGVPGSTEFHRAASGTTDRVWPLHEYVAASFATYASLSEDALRNPAIEFACDQLRALGVAPAARRPPSPTPPLTQARAASNQCDWPLAVTYWQEVLQGEPDLEEGYVRLTDALREVGDLDGSERITLEALAKFPGNFWLRRSWALVAQYRREFGEALTRYKQIVTDHQHDILQADIAACLLEVGDLSAAQEVVTAASLAYPQSDWLRAVREKLQNRLTE